jgi:hypothetical protein
MHDVSRQLLAVLGVAGRACMTFEHTAEVSTNGKSALSAVHSHCHASAVRHAFAVCGSGQQSSRMYAEHALHLFTLMKGPAGAAHWLEHAGPAARVRPASCCSTQRQSLLRALLQVRRQQQGGGDSVAGAEQLSGWDLQQLRRVDLGGRRSQPAGGGVCN